MPVYATLSEALQLAPYWVLVEQRDDGERIYGVQNKVCQTSPPACQYSTTDLEHLDPRLPDIFDYLCMDCGDLIGGADIVRVLDYWESLKSPVTLTMLPVEAIANAPLYARDIHVGTILNLNICGDTVRMVHQTYDVTKTFRGTLCPTATSYRDVDIKSSWLDQYHPGWRERMSLAVELGIIPSQIAQYTFIAQADPANQQELDGITLGSEL